MDQKIRTSGLPTDIVRKLQNGGMDSNGQLPEVHISNGEGVPCRHCLKYVKAGVEYLILGHRPFRSVQPYAELGPIFLHAEECEAYTSQQGVPETITANSEYILRGYDIDERIVYGTGEVTPISEIGRKASELLADERVEFVHVRSSTNNCYAVRIDAEGD